MDHKGKERPDQDTLTNTLPDYGDRNGDITGDRISHALAYAVNGWPVVPCRHRDTYGVPAKAPYGGIKAATCEPNAVRQLFQRHPHALIGVVPPPGTVVIDVDPRNGGTVDALAEMCGGRIPETLISESGRGDGGRHYWFATARTDLMQRTLAAGIDSRLAGKGVVIVPPSLHPVTGAPYTWLSASAMAPRYLSR